MRQAKQLCLSCLTLGKRHLSRGTEGAEDRGAVPRRHRRCGGGESPPDYGVWWSVVSSPSGVRGEAQAENNSRAFLSVPK